MITVWGRKNSINVQKVMWTLAELGLDHRRVDAGGAFGGLDAPSFRTMNPHGKIPVIDDDGVVVWESVAIIRYLAARYGRGSLWIDSPIERAAVDQWIEWCQTAWQRDFMDLFWAYYRTPDSDRNMKLVADKIGACTRHVETMDRVLAARPYLCGDKLTLGDIPAGAQLYRYFNLEIARPIAAHVTAWYKRLLARPGYRDHVAIPFDELRARLAY